MSNRSAIVTDFKHASFACEKSYDVSGTLVALLMYDFLIFEVGRVGLPFGESMVVAAD